jgi:two-component system, LytTR family, response regulator
MNESAKALNVLIVDDEIEACDNLKNMLHQYVDPTINVVGMANDTAEAGNLIDKYSPDAVFFDIEMPEENAFQFLEKVHPFNFEIIFVTAYDEFAVKAFRLNAVDYILKPICIDELNNAVGRLKERLGHKAISKYQDNQMNILKQISNKEPQYKITFKSLNHVEVVDFKDIHSIEGQGSYCKISFVKSGIYKDITITATVSGYEELLPPNLFFRIHKSHLINCMHLVGIRGGEVHEVLMRNNCRMPVSRRRYATFIKFLRENNFYSE